MARLHVFDCVISSLMPPTGSSEWSSRYFPSIWWKWWKASVRCSIPFFKNSLPFICYAWFVFFPITTERRTRPGQRTNTRQAHDQRRIFLFLMSGPPSSGSCGDCGYNSTVETPLFSPSISALRDFCWWELIMVIRTVISLAVKALSHM